MERLARLLLARPGRTLLAFGLVAVAAVLVTGRLRLEQDIFAFLPANDLQLQTLAHVFRSSMDQDKAMVLVRGRTVQGEGLAALGDALAAEMERLTIDGRPAFSRASPRKTEALGPGVLENLLGLFASRPELFLTASDRDRLAAFLASPPAMAEEVRRTLAYLGAPGTDSRATGILLDDPLNIRRFLIDKLALLQTGLRVADGPFLLSRDGRALLIVATPARPPSDQAFAQALTAVFAGLAANHPEADIALAGGYAVAAEEEGIIRGDLVSSMAVSTVCIAALFFLAYRRISVMFLALVPLGVGLQFALAVLAAVWGRAHMLAAAFSSAVVGLALDYSILIYDRYTLERSAGVPSDLAARRTITTTGGAVAACALTTGASFWVLTLVDNPGLAQVGWMVTLAIVFSMAATAWVLPAWLAWRERHAPPVPLFVPSRYRLDALAAWIAGHKGLCLALAALLLGACLPGLTRLRFETDPNGLRPRGLSSLAVQQEIRTHFGQEKLALVTWKTADPAAFWREGAALDAALADLAAAGQVAGWSSITGLSGGPWTRPIQADRAGLAAVLADNGLPPGDFPRLSAFLDTLARPRPAGDGCAWFQAYPSFLQRFFRCDATGYQGITWVALAPAGSLAALADRVTGLATAVAVFDPDASVQDFMASAGTELSVTVAAAVALTLLILFLFFRNATDVLLSLLPPVCGILASVGAMGYLGIRLNTINLIYIPILVGIGSDAGIVIVDRFRESGDVALAIRTAGKSVLLNTLTSCLGFGSLVTAQYHVLADLGLLTILGMSGCCLFALLALPGLLRGKGARLVRGA
jgi:predicted RND superfamily exporter protein